MTYSQQGMYVLQADEEEIDIDTLSEAEQEKLMMKRYRKQTMARKLQTSVRTFISDFATFIYFCLLFTIGEMSNALQLL